MRKIIVLILFLACTINVCLASNYQSNKSYKLIERNSRGQKISYTKIYYKGDKSNVQKVEVYGINGKRIRQYRR